MTAIDDRLRTGLVVWAVGTIAELVLLGGLAIEAVRRRDVRSVGRFAAPLAIERAVVHGVGPMLDRDRPRSRLRRPAFVSPSSSSMPSGHTSHSFLAATLLSSTRAPWIVFPLAVVASGSRGVLRVHRITEIGASAAVGVALGVAMNQWVAPEQDDATEPGGRGASV